MGTDQNPSEVGTELEPYMTQERQFVFASVTTTDAIPASAIPYSSKLSNHIGDSNSDLGHLAI